MECIRKGIALIFVGIGKGMFSSHVIRFGHTEPARVLAEPASLYCTSHPSRFGTDIQEPAIAATTLLSNVALTLL